MNWERRIGSEGADTGHALCGVWIRIDRLLPDFTPPAPPQAGGTLLTNGTVQVPPACGGAGGGEPITAFILYG